MELAAVYISRLKANGVDAETEEQPTLNQDGQDSVRICEVKCVKSELLKLAATTFVKDIVTKTENLAIGWDEILVTRYQFKTEEPLPAPLSVAEIGRGQTKVIEMSKVVCFEDKLRTFKKKLEVTLKKIEAVMPPKKVARRFSKSGMGLSAAPIVRFMRKIADSKPEKQPFYALAMKCSSGNRSKSSRRAIYQT
jgi:hypothetical protein